MTMNLVKDINHFLKMVPVVVVGIRDMDVMFMDFVIDNHPDVYNEFIEFMEEEE